MRNLQKLSSRWVVPLTLRPADDEKTRFLPDCGYETVECQLDSGSTCEVMTLRQCCQILQNGDPKLDESHCRLRFYDGSTITPVGVCHFICQKNDCEAKLSFQIIDTEEERQIPPLLSATACEQLQLITRNFFVTTDRSSARMATSSTPLSKEDILQKYANVFNGLDRLPGKHRMYIPIPP